MNKCTNCGRSLPDPKQLPNWGKFTTCKETYEAAEKYGKLEPLFGEENPTLANLRYNAENCFKG